MRSRAPGRSGACHQVQVPGTWDALGVVNLLEVSAWISIPTRPSEACASGRLAHFDRVVGRKREVPFRGSRASVCETVLNRGGHSRSLVETCDFPTSIDVNSSFRIAVTGTTQRIPRKVIWRLRFRTNLRRSPALQAERDADVVPAAHSLTALAGGGEAPLADRGDDGGVERGA